GGRLAALAGGAAEIMVNSLHGQGIDRLAPGLIVEATAPDGLIEAVAVEDQPFAIGAQWHPEWRFQDNPFSAALFAAFGAAARDYAAKNRAAKG
ncbi:MAG TPA: gamma-glutamyl-gamma-aminobutyrate hydrolase family protein, partial [Azospirillaceae bacterium]|nr:gamma-glutamyl-gamma-aminobutyrate hydrolase family protein [Azospirillaceae bacterium]